MLLATPFTVKNRSGSHTIYDTAGNSRDAHQNPVELVDYVLDANLVLLQQMQLLTQTEYHILHFGLPDVTVSVKVDRVKDMFGLLYQTCQIHALIDTICSEDSMDVFKGKVASTAANRGPYDAAQRFARIVLCECGVYRNDMIVQTQ